MQDFISKAAENVLSLTRHIPPLIIYSSKMASFLQKLLLKGGPLLLWVHCKCNVSAVTLPSQITLLSLRIRYVFSSLSSLNLPLSCPEPFVANRARRSEVLKVDVWVGDGAKVNVAAQCFLLPTGSWCLSAFISVGISQSQRPHAACIAFGSEEASVWSRSEDAHEVVKLGWASSCCIVTERGNVQCWMAMHRERTCTISQANFNMLLTIWSSLLRSRQLNI